MVISCPSHGPEPRQPKVGDLQLTVLSHQNVSGLEIPMNYTVLMEELYEIYPCGKIYRESIESTGRWRENGDYLLF